MSQLCLNMSVVPSSPDYMSQDVPLKLRRCSSIRSITVPLSHEISCKIKQCVKTQFPCTICDALRNLVSFLQFERREKHPSRSATFSKVATLLKVILLAVFFNCTNGTKSHKAPYIIIQNTLKILKIFQMDISRSFFVCLYVLHCEANNLQVTLR